MSLLEEVCHWGWTLRVEKTQAILVLLRLVLSDDMCTLGCPCLQAFTPPPAL